MLYTISPGHLRVVNKKVPVILNINSIFSIGFSLSSIEIII